MNIFVITLVGTSKEKEKTGIGVTFAKVDTRTVGFFFDKEKAFEAIKADLQGFHECKWDNIVVEEFGESAWVSSKNEYWFKWNRTKRKFVPCKKPALLSKYNVKCFGMG